jgi:flagellin
MGLRINTNVAALNTTRILRRSSVALNRSLERLSSGLRINRAADDAAGLAIAESMRSQTRGFAVAQRNAQDGISMVQIAEGALSEIGNMMQRIRELLVQGANGTNSPANLTALSNEANELITAITDTIANTEFNSINPFLAIAGGITVQSGADTGDTTILTNLGVAFTAAAGGDLNLVFGAGQTVDFSTSALAGTSLTQIDLGLDRLNAKRAEIGAVQNSLEFTLNVLAIKEENTLAAESAIRDADIAFETTEFTRNQILVTAGTSLLAQANLIPQTALQLLG